MQWSGFRVLAWFCAVGILIPALALADGYEYAQVIVSLNPGHTIEEVNARWGTSTLDAFPEGNLYLLEAEGLGDIEALALQMTADPAVQEAEANYYRETPESIRQMVVIIVGGEYVDYEDQTIGERIGLDQAHAMSRGAGVTVAILDTGVDPNHEALAGRLAPDGFDFVSLDDQPWDEANGLDDDEDGAIDEGHGHGTMVAGIVALVAPEATLLPVRVLNDEGRSNAYILAKGIRYAANHGADVINMSFGALGSISAIGHQLDYADANGIVLVAGAGNENREQGYYPAADSKAYMITALDSLDIKAAFADWDSKVLVSAPGTGVRSSFPDGRWAMGNGCSFATPFISGEAALIRSLAPQATTEQIEDRVAWSVVYVDDIPENEPYRGKLGEGRVYLPTALRNLAAVSGSDLSVERIQAVPNPSSGEMRLSAPLGEGSARAEIFDSAGRKVRALTLEGAESTLWDGAGEDGGRVPPGVYYVRASRAGQEYSTRVTILR